MPPEVGTEVSESVPCLRGPEGQGSLSRTARAAKACRPSRAACFRGPSSEPQRSCPSGPRKHGTHAHRTPAFGGLLPKAHPSRTPLLYRKPYRFHGSVTQGSRVLREEDTEAPLSLPWRRHRLSDREAIGRERRPMYTCLIVREFGRNPLAWHGAAAMLRSRSSLLFTNGTLIALPTLPLAPWWNPLSASLPLTPVFAALADPSCPHGDTHRCLAT
jgi:hypothetical protein